MLQLLDNETLILEYKPEFGAWTYYLRIPHTQSIVGKWGFMKVIGVIDNYLIKDLNLAPRKNEDKIISINKHIRDSIKKDAGDTVTVTLYLLSVFDDESTINQKINELVKNFSSQ